MFDLSFVCGSVSLLSMVIPELERDECDDEEEDEDEEEEPTELEGTFGAEGERETFYTQSTMSRQATVHTVALWYALTLRMCDRVCYSSVLSLHWDNSSPADMFVSPRVFHSRSHSRRGRVETQRSRRNRRNPRNRRVVGWIGVGQPPEPQHTCMSIRIHTCTYIVIHLQMVNGEW